MRSQALRAMLFALYQLSILAGIVLLPVSLVTNRFGVPFPAGRVVATLGDTYEAHS